MSETIGPGSIVKVMRCRECGSRVSVKLNKRRTAYYFCTGEHGDPACSHHERWSRFKSEEFAKAAVMSRREVEAAERRKPANDNHAPEMDTGLGAIESERDGERSDAPANENRAPGHWTDRILGQ